MGNDNTVRFDNLTLQIESQTFRYSLARCRVLVCRHLDGTLSLYYGQHRWAATTQGQRWLPVLHLVEPRQRPKRVSRAVAATAALAGP